MTDRLCIHTNYLSNLPFLWPIQEIHVCHTCVLDPKIPKQRVQAASTSACCIKVPIIRGIGERLIFVKWSAVMQRQDPQRDLLLNFVEAQNKRGPSPFS